MPITRIGNKIVYFAHVPKCAGSSVEAYLAERFGPIAFRDGKFNKLLTQPTPPWNRSSPQHIPVEWLDRLFPPGFFDASFAIVRDPVARLVSAYLYQRDDACRISTRIPFSRWLGRLETVLGRRPFAWDNHFAPMHRLVPADAQIFRIEDGLMPLVDWLDTVAGDSNGPRAMPTFKSRAARLAKTGTHVEDLVLTAADLAVIKGIYAEDYSRFGYTPPLSAPA